MTNLESALSYLKSGMSVIPVSKDKKPMIKWTEFQTRLPTEDEVKVWFTNPEAQIGIVTGKISNICVVDVDVKDGKIGDDSFLPATTIAKTGGGGKHYYYTYKPMKNKVRTRELIDIRAEGGYIIAPPSVTEKGSYEWLVKTPTLPDFPLHLFTDEPQKKISIDSTFCEYDGKGEGGRNDAMARYTGSVLSRMHPSMWDNIAWNLVVEANNKNTPPLDEFELRATFDSIKASERTRVEEEDKWKDTEEYQDDDEISLIKDLATEGFDQRVKYPTGFPIVDEAMEGGVAEGDLVIITGVSGEGKTSISQTITCNLVKKMIPVLWFSYEVTLDALNTKFKVMGVSSEYPIYAPKKLANGNVDWIKYKIMQGLEKYDTKVVVIDHLDFLTSNKNKSQENEALAFKKITTELKNIARDLKITIIAMAHLKKLPDGKEPDMQDIGYSAGIFQLADYVLIINRIRNQTTGNMFSSGEIYSKQSKLKVVKNRLNGKCPYAILEMKNEKFEEYVDVPNF